MATFFLHPGSALQTALVCCGMVLGTTSLLRAAEPSPSPLQGPGATVSVRNQQVEQDRFQKGVQLFSDRNYRLLEVPEWLDGQPFLRGSIERHQFEVAEAGVLTILIPVPDHPATIPQDKELEQKGFVRISAPESFQLFGPQKYERVCIYQKEVQPRERFQFHKFAIVVGQKAVVPWTAPQWTDNSGEKLENGIVLPAVWPPDHLNPKSAAPMPVPYLDHPPQVIGIHRGRQLFVDDFLIEQTDLKRVYHQARKYDANPVFKPETLQELAPSTLGERGQEAVCYLGHGGVFFDPADQIFKMYYTAGWRGGLALATSKDLIHWERPKLNSTGENLLLPRGGDKTGGDNCVWLDVNSQDPAQRLKFMTDHGRHGHRLLVSADGRQWSEGIPTGRAGDYCSFFYNPFRNVWVYSIKQGGSRGRNRYYAENADFLKGADWSRSVYWTNADELDEPEPEGDYPHAGESPQLYSLNAVAYESLLVGMHYIHRGPKNELCDQGKFPKLTDLELGFSRDGFHWHRPDRSGFLRGERTEGTWDRAYLHGTTGVFVVLGDRLVFPYTAYSGIAPSGARGMYTGASVGIATLRRDGFASLNADEKGGTLTTRPVSFSGSELFVNVDAPQGTLRVAVVDDNGEEIAPFTLKNCHPLRADSTLERVSWEGGSDLSQFRNQSVRFKFELVNGSLYSFWVSSDQTGRSEGYVAAGGPGYPGTVDTVGRAALSTAK